MVAYSTPMTRPGADGNQDAIALEDTDIARIRGDLDPVRIEKAGGALERLHAIAGKLVLQHIDLVVERHVQAHHQVLGGDVLLHSVGAAIEAALPPSGEVEHGFAQRLRGNGAGMHRDAADPAAPFHHEHGAVELGGLNGGTAPGWAAADDDEVEGAHGREGWRKVGRSVYRIERCSGRRVGDRIPCTP